MCVQQVARKPSRAELQTHALEVLATAASRCNCEFQRLDEWRLVCAELIMEHHHKLTTHEITALDYLISLDI